MIFHQPNYFSIIDRIHVNAIYGLRSLLCDVILTVEHIPLYMCILDNHSQMSPGIYICFLWVWLQSTYVKQVSDWSTLSQLDILQKAVFIYNHCSKWLLRHNVLNLLWSLPHTHLNWLGRAFCYDGVLHFKNYLSVKQHLNHAVPESSQIPNLGNGSLFRDF